MDLTHFKVLLEVIGIVLSLVKSACCSVGQSWPLLEYDLFRRSSEFVEGKGLIKQKEEYVI